MMMMGRCDNDTDVNNDDDDDDDAVALGDGYDDIDAGLIVLLTLGKLDARMIIFLVNET